MVHRKEKLPFPAACANLVATASTDRKGFNLMSIRLLRGVVSRGGDDPRAILQALQEPWDGALNRPPYTEILVFCATARQRKIEQMKMLGLLGADMSAVSTPGLRAKKIDRAGDDPFLAIAASRRATNASTVALTDPVDLYKAVLIKFRGQLNSEAQFNGALQRDRVAFKGTLIAQLENKGACQALLPSMKRSLVLDASSYAKGYSATDLEAAINKLVSNDRNSFFWCSLTGNQKHAVDTVIRITDAGVELTTCNRGAGASEQASGVAGALRSVWPSAKALAEKLAPWTLATTDSMQFYNYQLHGISPAERGVDKSKHSADYRPQKIQKEGNCATKSMFAALNLLMATDGPGTERYKAFRRSLDAALTDDLQRTV